MVDSVLETFASNLVSAFELAWEVVLKDVESNWKALWTKKKLLQWLAQFPYSIATVASTVLVDFLGSLRLGLQTIQQAVFVALIQTILDRIPFGHLTSVCTQRQAIQGAVNLFADAVRSAATANLPIELIVARRIRQSNRFFETLRLFLSGALERVGVARVLSALKSMLLVLFRTTILVGGAIAGLSIALFMANAITTKPNSYFKTLSQARGRAFVTKKQYQRI